MTTFQMLMLIVHVLTGVGAVILSYAVWMMLLKQMPNILRAAKAAWWAFALTVASWITGGYYYVVYYGTAVKPVIKAGKYPWAHTLMTEAKEHLFLFLPVLTFALAIVLWMQREREKTDKELQRALVVLAAVTVLLGIAITLFGVVISGAYRPVKL